MTHADLIHLISTYATRSDAELYMATKYNLYRNEADRELELWKRRVQFPKYLNSHRPREFVTPERKTELQVLSLTDD